MAGKIIVGVDGSPFATAALEWAIDDGQARQDHDAFADTWRDLPAGYGPWSTAYDRFRSWTTAGVFEQLMQAMIGEAAGRGQVDLSLVSVDSTTACAHHHAAGMILDSELAEALEEAAEREKGRRQRGKSPKTAEVRAVTPMRTDADGYNGGAVLDRIKVRLSVGRPRTRPGAAAVAGSPDLVRAAASADSG